MIRQPSHHKRIQQRSSGNGVVGAGAEIGSDNGAGVEGNGEGSGGGGAYDGDGVQDRVEGGEDGRDFVSLEDMLPMSDALKGK